MTGWNKNDKDAAMPAAVPRRPAPAGRLQKLSLIAFGTVIGCMLTLNFSAHADKEQVVNLPLSELHSFAEVYGKIKSDYVETTDDKKLIESAINGMVTDLDPHSAYLNAEAFHELEVGTSGEFGGLGIEVGMENGVIKVVSPIEDTPAWKAGVKAGDLIIKLDDKPVKGMTLNDAVKLMRGKPGTTIRLTILRKGVDKPFELKVSRAVIQVKSVKYKLVQPDYGYVRITEFQERSGEDLAHAVEAMYRQNKRPLKGMILDLRNNPGGLLNAAVGVAGVFLPQNSLVVYTKGRAPDSHMQLTVSPENYLRGPEDKDFLKGLPAGVKNVPLVVLINGGSASASEIVSGALQDHKRATIIGTQSFGKGSVQTILPLGDGTALKLTTARYFTPAGRSIQLKGITPDYKVADVNTPADTFGLREEDLAHALANPLDPTAGKGADKAQAQAAELKAEAAAKNAAKMKPVEPTSAGDWQFQQAIGYLHGKKPVENPPKK